MDGARWRKSSFSGGASSGSGCVEVAFLGDGDVALRDTKDRSLTPHRYSTRGWAAFVAGVRAGEFDTP
ncbi:MAG: DUF397 domain-containing protein [Pseudonocardia sp.]|nr:DUF397 domain-containing protein [Pseudonocardia sp.]